MPTFPFKGTDCPAGSQPIGMCEALSMLHVLMLERAVLNLVAIPLSAHLRDSRNTISVPLTYAGVQAAKRGVKRIRLHLLTDGRDCTDGSSVKLMQKVLDECKELGKRGCDAQVASGGGRMKVTMDRY